MIVIVDTVLIFVYLFHKGVYHLETDQELFQNTENSILEKSTKITRPSRVTFQSSAEPSFCFSKS